MKYESPRLSLMGQMEELTGSTGVTFVAGDAIHYCPNIRSDWVFDDFLGKWVRQEWCE